MNQEAIGIPGDGALVGLVSDEKVAAEGNAGEGEKEVMPSDKVEEGTAVVDRLQEQAIMPSSPPPSS
jgi:hypothetical protein